MQVRVNSYETGMEEPIDAQAVQARREGMWREENLSGGCEKDKFEGKEKKDRVEWRKKLKVEEDRKDGLEEREGTRLILDLSSLVAAFLSRHMLER